jgi:hypothetical protein
MPFSSRAKSTQSPDTLFGPEQNLGIDKWAPVGARVKTKLGRGEEE